MNIKEIQDQLAELVAAMREKGFIEPEVQLSIFSSDSFCVYARSGCGKLKFSDFKPHFLFFDTAEGALTAARDCIAALPSPDEAVTDNLLTDGGGE